MSYLSYGDSGQATRAFALFEEQFGYVPKLFRAQTLVPRLIEAEAAIARAVIFEKGALSRIQKELILLAVAVARGNTYCATASYQMLLLLGAPERWLEKIFVGHADGLVNPDASLLRFAVKLAIRGECFTREDVAGLQSQGFTEESALEAVLSVAWANFLCRLSTGLGVEPDFAPVALPRASETPESAAESADQPEIGGPYLRAAELPAASAAQAFFHDHFGFLPNLYRAQSLNPAALESEAAALTAILFTSDGLKRVQKERILLAVSAVHRNAYFVALHSEVLGLMGMAVDESYQVAEDHRQARLPDADHALLEFAVQLASNSWELSNDAVETLRQHPFSDSQILEAVAITALTCFLNTIQRGLGCSPDFPLRRSLRWPSENIAHLLRRESRPTDESGFADPDGELIARAQDGDLQAFEALIHAHGKRVYRTLLGILGNADEACDAMQDTFLKAFRGLAAFQRRSRFSTWLVSIASNTAIQRLRERRPLVSLDEDEPDEGFRPRQIRAWTDDPEQLYSQTERRALIERCVMALPAKYRVVVLLRDVEQLPAEDAAAALGLGIPALKSRLLRGRLMLRETLAPHFTRDTKGVNA